MFRDSSQTQTTLTLRSDPIVCRPLRMSYDCVVVILFQSHKPVSNLIWLLSLNDCVTSFVPVLTDRQSNTNSLFPKPANRPLGFYGCFSHIPKWSLL